MKGKASQKVFKLLTLSLVLSLSLFLASCASSDRSGHVVLITPQSILEDQRRQEADIREEARGGPVVRTADYRRMRTVLAFRRQREQQQLAQFAQFQMDQKLALASASSPKMLVTSGEIPTNYRQVDYGNTRGHREINPNRRYLGSLSQGAGYSTIQGADSHHRYPDRFYQRQIQEESAAQAEAAFNAAAVSQQSEPDPDTPYAVPVPGRPGFVTIPPKMGGHIDVRGYAPGAFVMDPWTKTIIRVP